MPLREPSPIPIAFDFVRFLASSITFMAHLQDVSVFINGRRLARLIKEPGVPTPTMIPRGLKTTSPQGIMRVVGVRTTCELVAQFDFWRDTDPALQRSISRLR